MIVPFRGVAPSIAASAFVADSAVVIGDVVIGADTSLWFHAVVRGDVYPIRIGRGTNVQDHATLHVLTGRAATTVGDDVTIGHSAIVHGCTIGNRTLVGMGAIVLDGVEVGDDCLIGAGALLTPGTRIPAGQLVLGSPAKATRPLTDEERASLLVSAQNYAKVAAEYRAAGLR
jgi:carbonic anhydrase/acetyltransferase-like protein (isoleucine patch superfamily)